MNFQEFLARKRALALVEHMDTLSESDALDLFNSLDEDTVEFIEQVLSEFEISDPYEPDLLDAQRLRRKMQQARGEIRKKYGRPETRKPGEIDTDLKLRFKRYKRDKPVAEAAKPETPRQRDYYSKLARREAGEPETRSGLLPRTVDGLKTRLRKFKTVRQAGGEPKY